MSIEPGKVAIIERILDDTFVTVDRQPGSRSGQQSFPDAEVSELGLVWLTRLLNRIDPAERGRLEQHLFLPVAVIAHPHSRPIGWLLPDVPEGPCRTVADIRTGQGDRLRDALAMAKQLADLADVMERHNVVDASLAPGRVVVIPGARPRVRALLGPSTRVDGVPLLLDPPTPAMSDRLCLAHLIDLLLPSAVRDHPTLRDLKTLASCWRDHDMSLAPALWSTALGDALRSLGAEPPELATEPPPAAPPSAHLDVASEPPLAASAPAHLEVAPVEPEAPEPAPVDVTPVEPAPAAPPPVEPPTLDTAQIDPFPDQARPHHAPGRPGDEPTPDTVGPDVPEAVLANLDDDPVIELLVRQERQIGGIEVPDTRAGLTGLEMSALTSSRRVELIVLFLVAAGVVALTLYTLNRL